MKHNVSFILRLPLLNAGKTAGEPRLKCLPEPNSLWHKRFFGIGGANGLIAFPARGPGNRFIHRARPESATGPHFYAAPTNLSPVAALHLPPTALPLARDRRRYRTPAARSAPAFHAP